MNVPVIVLSLIRRKTRRRYGYWVTKRYLAQKFSHEFVPISDMIKQ